jgi:hypothetical protein
MEQTDTLMTFAELAITATGFSGIVAVLPSRRTGDSNLDAASVWRLLFQALTVVLFSLLPVFLDSLGVSPTRIWRVLNGTFGVWHAVILVWIARTVVIPMAKGAGVRAYIQISPLMGGGAAIVVIQILESIGVSDSFGYSIYFAGLSWLLMMSLVNFCLLVAQYLGNTPGKNT